MKPATTDELVERLQVLFAALPTSQAGEGSDLKMQAYLLAVSKFSVETVTEAMMAVLGGTAGVSPRFAPTPPELAQICREREARHWREMARLRQEQERVFSTMNEPTREERARIVARIEMVSAQLGRSAEGDRLAKEQADVIRKSLDEIAAKARGA